MKELWKSIIGYEGFYEVSNLGRVKSFNKTKSGIILKQTVNHGYLQVKLYKNGLKKTIKVHRLVAEAFIVNLENKPQVNHIDEDRSNNKVNNLEWTTCKENNNHGNRDLKRVKTLNKTNFGRKRGIIRDIRYGGWIAVMRYGKKCKHLGKFNNKEDAYQAFYNEFILRYGEKPW